MHEATFDDDLRREAVAKKHSTTSEAIGIGVAMGARRVMLTHFSQRYQKIPSLSALDTRSIKLEDAEDIDDASADMEEPIEESTLPAATIDESSETVDDRPSQAQPELQPLEDVKEPVQPSSSTTDGLPETIASNINPTPRPLLDDMKIGVAFDSMRVKVGDIMHLDRFTPALVELYKDPEDEGDERRKKKAAKEAFADNEDDILQEEQRRRSQEDKAERARKGQIKAAKRQEASQKAKMMEKGEEDEKGIAGEGTMEGTEMTEKGEEDKKGIAGEGTMEGTEATEPVAEKMKAVQ